MKSNGRNSLFQFRDANPSISICHNLTTSHAFYMRQHAAAYRVGVDTANSSRHKRSSERAEYDYVHRDTRLVSVHAHLPLSGVEDK